MSNFRLINRDMDFLMPPSVDEWLPQRHLARFVVEVIEGLDLRAMTGSYRGSGEASYHPRLLLGLIIYGYAIGVFSSRNLERATYDSVAFRFIAANEHPDHDTIATFRRRFLEQIEALFVQVLGVAREMGVLKLGTVALDGTKIHANASRHSALSHEHASRIEAQLKAEVADLLGKAEAADQAEVPDGMQVPEELARREKRLAEIARAKAVNPYKFSAIAHRDHDYCNPIAAAKVERLLDLLPLEESSRVLDLGCGRARAGVADHRALRRDGGRRRHLVADARPARERAEWTRRARQAPSRRHRHPRLPRRPRDVPPHASCSAAAASPVACAGICTQLKAVDPSRRLRADRRRLLAHAAASARIPSCSGAEHDEFLDHRGNVQARHRRRAHPVARGDGFYADEWDEYEWKYCRAIEGYAAGQPADPGRPGDPRAHPALARRLPALGPRHAGIRRVSFPSTRWRGMIVR